jgi:hypothetical protein
MLRPTKAQLQAATAKTVPDVIAPGLAVLFVGINPGLYSAAVGHHFARPGNRFWPALFESGFTPRLLHPEEDGELPAWGLGITNLVARATAAAAELSEEELRAGGGRAGGDGAPLRAPMGGLRRHRRYDSDGLRPKEGRVGPAGGYHRLFAHLGAPQYQRTHRAIHFGALR